MERPTYSALFIDFENVYYYLKQNTETTQELSDIVARVVRNLKDDLVKKHRENSIIAHAYADFERIEENAQGALYLIGVETHNVLSTDHKNAADMRLCIDVMETLYMRPEIETFVLVAGDRDYIPVVQHLRNRAKTVRVVAFQNNVSGDLVQIVGEAAVIKAETLLPATVKIDPKRVEMSRRQPSEPEIKESGYENGGRVETAPPPLPVRKVFKKAISIKDELVLDAIRIMLENYASKPEIWVTPFLNKLRAEMSYLAEYERKNILTEMELAGAIVVEKRRGEPNDYSVIIVNWDHPNVRALTPEFTL
jgi:uncharacterized LabA/DUF88 family protein